MWLVNFAVEYQACLNLGLHRRPIQQGYAFIGIRRINFLGIIQRNTIISFSGDESSENVVISSDTVSV